MAYGSYDSPFGGFTLTPWVKRLLIANAVVEAVAIVMGLGGMRGAIWQALAFQPAEIVLRPWTILTYMFVHGGFFHFFFNMLVLFFFGPPLEERWGSRDFLKFYLVAGIGGALLSILEPHASVGGASAAMYGVMLAYAMAWPDNLVYIWGIFPVKVKWLVAGLAAFSVFGALGTVGSGVAHWAHLGGFVTAFLYLKSPWAPSPWGAVPQRRKAKTKGKGGFAGLQLPWKRKPAAPPPAPAPTSTPQNRPGTPKRPSEEQRLLDDVDRILEKISARGLGSLTDEERKRLDEVSRRYRSN